MATFDVLRGETLLCDGEMLGGENAKTAVTKRLAQSDSHNATAPSASW